MKKIILSLVTLIAFGVVGCGGGGTATTPTAPAANGMTMPNSVSLSK